MPDPWHQPLNPACRAASARAPATQYVAAAPVALGLPRDCRSTHRGEHRHLVARRRGRADHATLLSDREDASLRSRCARRRHGACPREALGERGGAPGGTAGRSATKKRVPRGLVAPPTPPRQSPPSSNAAVPPWCRATKRLQAKRRQSSRTTPAHVAAERGPTKGHGTANRKERYRDQNFRIE